MKEELAVTKCFKASEALATVTENLRCLLSWIINLVFVNIIENPILLVVPDLHMPREPRVRVTCLDGLGMMGGYYWDGIVVSDLEGWSWFWLPLLDFLF